MRVNDLIYISMTVMLTTISMTAYSNAELVDPTRPETYVTEEKEPVFIEDVIGDEKINWIVSAIRISESDKSAIVNGQLVREGDAVGPAEIFEIKPLSVVIDHEDIRLIVRLFKNQIVKEYK